MGARSLLLCAVLALAVFHFGQAGQSRTVYISAEEHDWLYLNGHTTEQCTSPAAPAGKSLSPATLYNKHFVFPPSGTFKKAVYTGYTDGSFTTKKLTPDSQRHLGILGPLIYAEAGSSLNIVLRNALPFPVNIQPVGALTWATPGDLAPVAPGTTRTVTWTIPDDTVNNDERYGYQNSRMVLYTSSVDTLAHMNAGLIGPIIVTAKGHTRDDGTTKGIVRDMVTLYQVVDESLSPFATDNAKANGFDASQPFKTYSVNGRSWCTLEHLDVVAGERVRWHVASAGIQDNVHNFHWHGNTLLHEGHRTDGLNLAGVNTATLDVTPDMEGTWLFHCHVNDHLDSGMIVTYNVLPGARKPKPFKLKGEVRRMYIAAEEVEWDYAPLGADMCSGAPQPFNEMAQQYLGVLDDSKLRVGSKYIKPLYVEYSDATFTQRVIRPASQAYLGLLGPTVRASVGDQIKILFKNKLKYPVSLHPHGVMYDKYSEGAGYRDNSANDTHGDDFVMPNSTYTYVWNVPERAGPGPADPSSMVWLTHSHVDETGDSNGGLIMPMVINRKGVAQQVDEATAANPLLPASERVGLPEDVDQEVIIMLTVMDERASIYAVDNAQRLPSGRHDLGKLFDDETFQEASKHHSINGFMYCNNPPMAFEAGRKVRFHVFAYGATTDIHTPSISGGGTFQMLGLHHSSFATIAGGMKSLDVVFTAPGQYPLVCRVHDHAMAGMELLYSVEAPEGTSLSCRVSVRKYYVAAEEVTWDYAPKGYQQCGDTDRSEQAQLYLTPSACSIGSKRQKALFREYTDGRFKQVKAREAYLGMLGPVITAEVGEVIEVVLKNKLPFPVAFTPDGGLVPLHDATKGKAVPPGTTFTYRFLVPRESGPIDDDLSTSAYPYFSGVNMISHVSAGLVGILNIGRRGAFRRADHVTPKAVDQQLFLLFGVTDESLSPLHPSNAPPKFTTNAGPQGKGGAQPQHDGEGAPKCENEDLQAESERMHAINGYSFCNLPAPTLLRGARVRVTALVVGSEEGIHTPTFTGQTLLTDTPGVVEFGEAMPLVAVTSEILVTSRTGLWPLVDSVVDHQANGEIAQVQVVSRRHAAARRLL